MGWALKNSPGVSGREIFVYMGFRVALWLPEAWFLCGEGGSGDGQIVGLDWYCIYSFAILIHKIPIKKWLKPQSSRSKPIQKS